MSKAKISIVIGTYNRKRMLINCIKSIRNNGITEPYEIIVIDGGSNDGTHKWLSKQKDILAIIHHNRYIENRKLMLKRSWGYFMNLGFKSAEGKYICMLSDDLYIHPNSIMFGFNLLEDENNQAMGACAFPFRDCFISEQFFIYKANEDKILVNHGMYRKDLLSRIGWIDEDNYKFYLADTDLSLKIWNKGYQIAISYDSCIEHFRYDFDQMRSGNLIYSKESQDYLKFRGIWGLCNKDSFSIKKEYFPQIARELRMAHVPKSLLFRFLFIRTWIKKTIKKNPHLFQIIKSIKDVFFIFLIWL